MSDRREERSQEDLWRVAAGGGWRWWRLVAWLSTGPLTAFDTDRDDRRSLGETAEIAEIAEMAETAETAGTAERGVA